MEVEVDAPPAVAQRDRERAPPQLDAGPPQDRAGNGEQQQAHAHQAIHNKAGAAGEQVNVQVEHPVDEEPALLRERRAGRGVGVGQVGLAFRIGKANRPPGRVWLRVADEGDVLRGKAMARLFDDRAHRCDAGAIERCVAQRGQANLILKDENGAAEADDDHVEREQDSSPQVHLKECLAEPEFVWMMKKRCEHFWGFRAAARHESPGRDPRRAQYARLRLEVPGDGSADGARIARPDVDVAVRAAGVASVAQVIGVHMPVRAAALVGK